MDRTNSCNWTEARSLTTSSERLRELYHSDTKIHFILGNNPNTPSDILRLLAYDHDAYIRFFVARNPSTPADIIEILAHDNAWVESCGEYVRGNVGLNPNAPDSVLELLAQDPEWRVRCCVAENPNSPIALLRTLAQDEPVVRCSVARNHNAPVELLQLLSSDESEYVRCCIAANPSTGADILDSLSRDQYYQIRTAVAGNMNTSVSTIIWLFSHVSEFRALVKEHMENNALYFDVEIYEEQHENFLLAIASNPNTPFHILKTLNSNSPTILGKALRNCVARNPAWNEG
jgi:hypothetical protein